MNELVILDIDGTLLPGQSQQRLVKYLFKHGYISVFSFLPLTFWFLMYKLRILKDPAKALNFALMFLKGWKVEFFDKVIDDFFKAELKNSFYQEGLAEIRKHQIANRKLLLLSNAVEPLVKKIADFLDIKDYVSTKLEIVNGTYSGKIEGGLVYGKAKSKLIKKYTRLKKTIFSKIWGYGDHISDLYFLNKVDFAFVVNPTKELEQIAVKKHWTILKFQKR